MDLRKVDLRKVVITIARRRLSRRGLHSSIENDQHYYRPEFHNNEAESGRFWPFCPLNGRFCDFSKNSLYKIYNNLTQENDIDEVKTELECS